MGIEGSANKVGIGKLNNNQRNRRLPREYCIEPQKNFYNPSRDRLLAQINR